MLPPRSYVTSPRNAADTSVAREYHAGLAAMLGIQAALAAQRGYLAEERIFETERGFCAVYGDTDGSSVTRGLGDTWDIITHMAIKLVPGGHPSHSLAEAAANAARAGQIAPDNVERSCVRSSQEGSGKYNPSSSVFLDSPAVLNIIPFIG